jgi:hypothetical protein
MLNIIAIALCALPQAIAYQGMSVENLPSMSLEERRQHLFNAYIEPMFNRRGADQPYLKQIAERWLIWLAQRMLQESQTVFLIERMQPNWLKTNPQQWMYTLGIGLMGELGLCIGLMGGLMYGLGEEKILIGGLILGLGLGLCLIGELLLELINQKINPVETLKWSWIKA